MITLIALFTVASIILISYLQPGEREEYIGFATGLPFIPLTTDQALVFPENFTSQDGYDSKLLENYTLYDSFNQERSDIWTKPEYQPTSTFIDTTFLPSNVEFLNGDLLLRSNVGLHQGSEYKTKEKFLYGKYRASIRTLQTPGTYMAFFLYTPDPANHNEIDIELVKTGNVSKAIFTTWVDMKKNEQTYVLGFDPSLDYHVYGFDWYPDHVNFFIDNMETPVCTSTSMVPQGSCYLYLNNWVVKKVPKDYGDGLNTMYVDWVAAEPPGDKTPAGN